MAVRVTVPGPQEACAAPLPMLFSGSPPPPDSLTSLHLYRSTNKRKAHHLELRAETERMAFTGANHGIASAKASAAGQLLVGLYNPSERTLKLVPAPTTFVMSGAAKKEHAAPVQQVQAGEGDGGAQSVAQQVAAKRQLVSEMGAQKARKRQAEVMKKKVNASNVLNQEAFMADVSSALEAAGASSNQLTAEQAHPLHPPFNLEATDPMFCYPRELRAVGISFGVYDSLAALPLHHACARVPSEGVLPSSVWEQLPFDGIDTSADGLRKFQNDPLWTPFLVERLRLLPVDLTAREEALKRILFLAYVLRFNGISKAIRMEPDTRPTRSEKDVVDAIKLQIDQPSWEYLVNTFTDTSGKSAGMTRGGVPRVISNTLREKLALHTLTLALLVTECVVPVAEFTK
ncbi:MAG: hypothetical protein SGPRY_010994, partial [Prymnesium sp.]